MKKLATFVTVVWATLVLIEAKCPNGCKLPITVYNDLKCRPIYSTEGDCCPVEYDCSHIYNVTDACHYKGKAYKPGEQLNEEDAKGSCSHSCRCQKSESSELLIQCPRVMDGCAEYWVSGYPGPGCYLRREPNRCCASGKICPPFDGNAKCEVNGKTYKEGELFDHPTQPCHKCSCKKGFAGEFEEPFCEEIKCHSEIKNSGAINSYCAPYYDTIESCCPSKWICLNKNGKFLPSENDRGSEGHLKCKFGEELVDIGKRYEDESQENKIYCECVVPPLMTCGPARFRYIKQHTIINE